MAVKTVKSHSRKTKSGKVVSVGSYSRATTESLALVKKKQKLARKKVKNLFYDKVKSTVLAKKLADRYKDYPMNAKLMTNAKWTNIKVTKHRTNKKTGDREPYTTTKRMLSLTGSEWKQLIKENKGLIHSVINRYFNFKSDLRDDLEREGVRAIYEAAGAYESKYNPEKPEDWMRHAYSYVRGFMQNELNRQMATHISMPYQKQRLYGKFKELWYRHNGDWDKIYKEMDLKKKDLYPSIAKEHANDPLPMEGYVTFMRKESLDKKTKAFEKKVNDINDRYQTAMQSLNMRMGGAEAREEYKSSLASYDKQISELDAKMKKTKSIKEKSEIKGQIEDLEASKDLYSKTFKPIESQEEFDRERKVIETVQQTELRDAKNTFDKEVDKTTLTGAKELFRQFETLMDFKEVNLSGDVQGNQGEYVSIESITAADAEDGASPNDLGSLDKIVLQGEFKEQLEMFLRDINQLDKRSATILKMRLGLHEDNELYAHGLWGKPMTIPEIAENIDPKLYARKDTQKGSHQKRLKNWRAKKPQKTYKTKISDAQFKKNKAEYEKRRNKAKGIITRKQNSKSWKPMSIEQRAAYRAEVYKKNKARVEDRPTKFVTKRRSKAAYDKAVKDWKATKPVKTHSRETMMKLVRRDVELASAAIRRLANVTNQSMLVHTYRKMRRTGGARPEIDKELMKSLLFEQTLGIHYCSEAELDLKKAAEAKAIVEEMEGMSLVDAVREQTQAFLGKLFGKPDFKIWDKLVKPNS